MWVLIDNYDSFTHILHHYLLQTGNDCRIFRNDEITVAQLAELAPSRIIISPGPETPLQAGISMELIRYFHDRVPILGVCLGHQALGMFFGAELKRAAYPMHGKTSRIRHTDHPLFGGIPRLFTAMRYHSLVIGGLAGTGLIPTATAEDDGTVMAVSHEHYPCTGVQFHPESVKTEYGLQLIRNWGDLL